MSTEIPSIMSHVSVGTDNFEKAVEFYKRVLATIGAKVVMEHPGAVAFGKQFPEFWVQTPIDGQPAGVGNGTHFGFIAPSNDAVHAFWEVALEMGAVPEGEPGPRPHYGEPYYGCFVRDLDGHKIEAAAWNAPL
ncbi:VOC family protein [Rhodobacteraceae bacterium RKSG542]|uniref:VOC family protein n=1 Tax=Pseudovibrio flavus TaxID=2529854 RepID=UPI003527EF9D|nr:VOC family protein [Pseudovibrio flavus]